MAWSEEGFASATGVGIVEGVDDIVFFGNVERVDGEGFPVELLEDLHFPGGCLRSDEKDESNETDESNESKCTRDRSNDDCLCVVGGRRSGGRRGSRRRRRGRRDEDAGDRDGDGGRTCRELGIRDGKVHGKGVLCVVDPDVRVQ